MNMKANGMKSVFSHCAAALVSVVLLSMGPAAAQQIWSQDNPEVCPGWNNPMSFTSGNQMYGNYYSAQIGNKSDYVTPNVSQGNTGINWTGGTTLTAAQMATHTMSTGGDCATFPTGFPQQNAFAIYTATTRVGSGPVNRDPQTGNNLAFVPTQFNNIDTVNPEYSTQLTRSIRIGDACGRPSSSVPNAEALFYNLHVAPENAMFFIYYSVVVEAPGHGTNCDPTFIIRVMKQNAAGVWKQASPTGTNPTGNLQCDTLAYMVPSTPYSTSHPDGIVVIGQGGWHQQGSGYSSVYYKDWTKVSLNLSNFMGEDVRIEVMVNDCCMTQHYTYAYICGECRPMALSSSGCPAGISSNVTTLTAPRGLDNYVWYASEYGVSPSAGRPPAYYTYRQLTDDVGTEADSAYMYRVQAEDFDVTYRPNEAGTAGIAASPDSVGNWQNFRCTMISALDPNKPFESHLYVNVQNTKPTMEIRQQSYCGGDVEFKNTSYVPGDVSDLVDLSSTTWSFYNNPNCLGNPDTVIVGDSAAMHYQYNGNQMGVRVRTNTIDTTCYSEAIYPITPLPNPRGGFTLSSRVLCDDDAVTLTDTTPGSTYREWRFRDEAEDSPMEPTEAVRGVGESNRQYVRSFTHGVEPIELMVRNGLYYLNPVNTSDTIWCENTIRDTVSVFLHPELLVVGDTIVCQGSLTDATVSAVGVSGCTYEWSLSPTAIVGGLPSGNHLAVAPYADTATYYVRVTSPQGCVAWDSIHAYLVKPRLSMMPSDGRICPGDVVTLTGSNAMSYTWLSSPVDSSLLSQDTNAVVRVMPQVSTTYTLIGHGGTGDNICDASPLTTQVKVFPYPEAAVSLYPEIVDTDDPTLTLTDASSNSVSTMWTFDGGEQVMGNQVTHTFTEATGVDSVVVTLTTTNELGCQTIYPFSIPVNLYTAWFPNVFTPNSEDANSRFRLFSINHYQHFHIYIYNRRGELIFESDDPDFEWDGTFKGADCPQGTYVYVCYFRKPGTYNLSQMSGNITLLR